MPVARWIELVTQISPGSVAGKCKLDGQLTICIRLIHRSGWNELPEMEVHVVAKFGPQRLVMCRDQRTGLLLGPLIVASKDKFELADGFRVCQERCRARYKPERDGSAFHNSMLQQRLGGLPDDVEGVQPQIGPKRNGHRGGKRGQLICGVADIEHVVTSLNISLRVRQ